MPIRTIEGLPNHAILLITSDGPLKLQIFSGNHIILILLIIKEHYIFVFLQKALLILLISCYHDVLLPILDPVIEYTDVVRLPIIMHNIIDTHVNHHVGTVVDTSCSHNRIFVHLCRTIEYSLLLG